MTTERGTRPVRIANCSGFYGDRISAAREMVEGGPIDVLTGDWLAELTMLILWKTKARNADGGYATTFLTQMEQVLGTCAERGIKVVSNAGGLNPAGCAAKVREIADRLGVQVRVAHVEGDDLMDRVDGLRPVLTNLDTGAPLTADPVSANAYLGGWGIARALAEGADVVVTGRVTDASVVVGPASWWWAWSPTDWDRLAGAVAIGHVIECGAQTTGGNYAFFREIPDLSRPLGFPLAEIDADGSGVITKHPGTGGLVSVGTVTAQLLYEIGAPAYPNPDVVARFDTIAHRARPARQGGLGATGAVRPARRRGRVRRGRRPLRAVATGRFERPGIRQRQAARDGEVARRARRRPGVLVGGDRARARQLPRVLRDVDARPGAVLRRVLAGARAGR
jgi:hypothetical protein